jgi:hypothetical protein
LRFGDRDRYLAFQTVQNRCSRARGKGGGE